MSCNDLGRYAETNGRKGFWGKGVIVKKCCPEDTAKLIPDGEWQKKTCDDGTVWINTLI